MKMTNAQIEEMKRAVSREDFARVILDTFENLILWEDKPRYLDDIKAEILSEVWAVFGDQ